MAQVRDRWAAIAYTVTFICHKWTPLDAITNQLNPIITFFESVFGTLFYVIREINLSENV
jgi:hypothetical protein